MEQGQCVLFVLNCRWNRKDLPTRRLTARQLPQLRDARARGGDGDILIRAGIHAVKALVVKKSVEIQKGAAIFEDSRCSAQLN